MKVAFSPLPAYSMEDLEHAIAQVPDAELVDAYGIVIRAVADFWLQLVAPDGVLGEPLEIQRDALARRAGGLHVFIAPDPHEICEALAHVGTAGLELQPLQLEYADHELPILQTANEQAVVAIRTAALDMALRAQFPRCLVEASQNHHFVLPSGAHTSLFIRLAEACVDLDTVDLFAYWVALELRRTDPEGASHGFKLVVDHPSMLLLGVRISKFFRSDVAVHALRSYSTDVQTRTETIDTLAKFEAHKVVLLIGIASTGRLARFVADCARAARRPPPATLVVFSVQEIPAVQVLCNLPLRDYSHFAPDETCGLCQGGSQPVNVSGSTYLVGYQPGQAVALPRQRFDKQRKFLERYGKVPGVLRVHYDDPNEYVPRHHAFYIDVGSLMRADEFRSEFAEALRNLSPRPDVVISPSHPTAEVLAEFAVGLLGCSRVRYVNALASALHDPAVRDALRTASTVLVLDDVFITGGRLDGINRSLREEGAALSPLVSTVHFLTLISTSASEERYAQRKAGLTGTHRWAANLSHLHEIPLPDWHDKAHCPWCKEAQLLSRIAQVDALMEGPVVDRLSALGNLTEGLSLQPYFLPNTEVNVPPLGDQSAVLGQGATSMQLLLACASAIQQQRYVRDKPLAADRYPAPTYLADRVFSTNYTERAIWLALLRGLRGHELEPSLKATLKEAALTLLPEHPEAFISGELAVVWLCGSLGTIPNTERARAFFRSLGIDWRTLIELGFASDEISAPDKVQADARRTGMWRTTELFRAPWRHFLRWAGGVVQGLRSGSYRRTRDRVPSDTEP